MISMMMFLMSLFVGKQIQQRPIDAVHHDTYSVAALADGMAYYQAQAIQKCWHEGASSCAAGSVDLANRTGSQTASGYGSGYETVTDGSTYIATTLDTQGAVAGRTHQESSVNSGVFAALKGMTSQSSAVGYYDQTAGGVVIPARDNEIVTVRFASTPAQGQPVVYATIATAPPPVQLASIDGGGYSPLVPIPPTVTPSPSSPVEIVSPPASVSPPETVSPIYTPPATVVINPIGPWAPSPVPPPSPPPVTSEQVALANTAKSVSYIYWGPMIFLGNITTDYTIDLFDSSGNTIYELACYPSNSINTPLVSGAPNAEINSIFGLVTGSDDQCAAAVAMIELLNSSMNSFYSDNSYLNITYNGYYKTINRTIHNYGISNMGVFGKSDVHFSGTALVEYYSTNDLYGLGSKIDQPKSGVSGPGLTYDQAALLDQYVSTMTGGEY